MQNTDRSPDMATTNGKRLIGLVTYLAEALARQPAKLTIKSTEVGQVIGVEIRATKDDTARIIGRDGTHIGAFKLLAARAGGMLGMRVVVTLLEPVNQAIQSHRRGFSKPNMDCGKIKTLVENVMEFFDPLAAVEIDDGMERFALAKVVCKGPGMPDDALEAFAVLLDVIGKASGRILQIVMLKKDKESNGNKQGRTG